MRLMIKFISAIALAFFLFLTPTPTFAQGEEVIPVQEFQKAEVIKIIEEGEKEIFEQKKPYQLVEVKILEGKSAGEIVTINHGDRVNLQSHQRVKVGDKVVIYRGGLNEIVDDFQIIDKYRLDNIYILLFGFFVLVILISRFKGLGSILGLIISFLIIIKFIVPQILAGGDPVLITIVGSSAIMLITLYLSHGFSLKTTVSLFSIIITLVITGLLSFLFLKMTHMSGLGDEAAYGLTFGPQTAGINFQGLLLGGIIIGALGVLDDVATTQTATIFELKKANKSLNLWQLFNKGMNVGKEHISSLVNTLFLAYTGVSLPLLLIIILNPSNTPMWFILNNEPIAEEIIRTVAGSLGLVLAVPITTFLASYFFSKKYNN